MKFSSALLVALTAFTVHAAPLEGVESIEKRQTREGGYTNVMNNLHVIRRDLSSLRSAVVANGGNANTYDGVSGVIPTWYVVVTIANSFVHL